MKNRKVQYRELTDIQRIYIYISCVLNVLCIMNILTFVCCNMLYVFMYFVCNNIGYFGKQQFKQPQTNNSALLSDSQIQMIGLPGCIRAKPMYQRMLFKSLCFQLDLKRCASKLSTTPVETGLFLASKTHHPGYCVPGGQWSQGFKNTKRL